MSLVKSDFDFEFSIPWSEKVNLGSEKKKIRTQISIFHSNSTGVKSKSDFFFSNFVYSLQEIWFFQLFTPRNRKVKSKIWFFCVQNLINSAFHSRNRKSWVEIRFFCSRLKFDLSLQNRSSNEWNIHFWWHKRRFFWLVHPKAQSWSTPYGKVRHSGVSLATMLLFLNDPRSVLLKYYWRGLPYGDDIGRWNDAGPYSETTSLVQLGTKRNFTVIWLH